MNQSIDQYLKSAKKELDDFFGIDVDLPEVCFINSRKHYDEMMGWKTEEYMVGHAKDGKIYILHPDIYVQESSHKSIDSFWKVLKHEYCHIYFRTITTITKIGYPKWLNEGLASYLTG
ncbi:MAG: hypothetical protein ABH887_01110 [bacterium]